MCFKEGYFEAHELPCCVVSFGEQFRLSHICHLVAYMLSNLLFHLLTIINAHCGHESIGNFKATAKIGSNLLLGFCTDNESASL